MMFNLSSVSHQYAGLNRDGTFRKPSRYTGIDRRGEGEKGRSGESRNEKWRRITGIFPHVEMSLRERRAGLARLMAWIEARVASHQTRRLEDTKTRSFPESGNFSAPRDFVEEVEEQGDRNNTPHPGLSGGAAAGSFARPSRSRGEGSTGGQATSGTRELSFTDEWEFSAESWARTRHCGICVEEICFELGISAGRLSTLTREYCGLRASEFVDGQMIRELKPMLFEKIRAAAFELWGAPGSFVWEKLAMFSGSSDIGSARTAAQAKEMVAGTPSARGGELQSRPECFTRDGLGDAEHAGAQAMSKVAGRGRPAHHFSGLRSQNGQSHVGRFAKSPGPCASRFGKSRYFRARPQELFEESRAEERARRLEELCEMLRARRGRTGSQLQTAAARGTLVVGANETFFNQIDVHGANGRRDAGAPRNGTGGQATSGTFAEFWNLDCGFRIGAAEIDAECLFNADAFALHAGFGSTARLKRACLNVFGKTLRRFEEVLAEEVLQFYLCAEDKELREIASRDHEIALVFRARELYHKSEDPPREPFLDEWSKFAELKPHWLSRMHEMFGS